MSEKTLNATAAKVSEMLVADTANKDTVFEKTLPEGLTMEHVNLTDTHRQDVTAGTINAIGIIGLQEAKSSGDHSKQSSIRVAMGKGSHIDATYTPKKEGTLPARNGGEPTKYTSWGSVSVAARTSLDTKGGQIGTALDLTKQITEETLSAK